MFDKKLTQETDLTIGAFGHHWFEMLIGFGRLLAACTGVVGLLVESMASGSGQ